jgi:hypothetical protein
MAILYERLGGFVGKADRLAVDEGLTTATASERGKAYPAKVLTPDEQAQLRGWVEAVKKAKVPEDRSDARRIADAYQMRLSVEGTGKVEVATLGFPVAGLGEWDPLLAWLDRTLTDEIRRHNPHRATILTPDELT